MPHDEVLKEELAAWLARGDEDLRVAAQLLHGTDANVTATILFHCQQAAEKALKGWLVWHGEIVRKTHDIEALGRQVCAIQPDLTPLIDRATVLSPYAYKFRYPGEDVLPPIEKAQAKEVMGVAVALLEQA